MQITTDKKGNDLKSIHNGDNMPRAPFQVLVFPFRKSNNKNFEYAIFRRKIEGYWQGIAGGGKEGESPLDAAKREAFEEANIPLSAKYFLLKTIASIPVYHFADRTLWRKDQYVVPEHCFAVEVSNFEIVLSEEHSEFKWVNYQTGENLLHWESNKNTLWELNERLLNDDLIPVKEQP